MSYIGSTPANKIVTSSDMEDGVVSTDKLAANAVTTAKITDGTIAEADIANDAVTADKIANAVNSAISANTAKTTNATHSGEVTGSGALTIADNVVDEANLKVSNSPTNGYFLSAQSGNTGGLTWSEVGGGGIENISTFRMTTNFTMTTGAQITANWSAAGVSLGTAISESSGTFSFPQTGIYRVEANFNLYRVQGDSDYIELNIKGTTDNSSYAELLSHWTHIGNVADQHSAIYGATIFDVTNTTNDKIRLHYESQSATNIRLIGSSDREGTYIRFIRLGDT